MQTVLSKARLPLCYLIILAFFLPFYQRVSGLTFIPLAYSFAEDQGEISSADVFIATVPLVLIPISTVLILVQTYMRRPIRKSVKALPLICLALFTVILFLIVRTIVGSGMSTLRILSHLREGYYLTALGSVLIPFTRSPYRRPRKKVEMMEAEVA